MSKLTSIAALVCVLLAGASVPQADAGLPRKLGLGRGLKQITFSGNFDLSQGVGFGYGYNLGTFYATPLGSEGDTASDSIVFGTNIENNQEADVDAGADAGVSAAGVAGGSFTFNFFGIKGEIGNQVTIAGALGDAEASAVGSTGSDDSTFVAESEANNSTPIAFQSSFLDWFFGGSLTDYFNSVFSG